MNKMMLVLAGALMSLPAAAAVPVPEPGSLGLLGIGVAAVLAARLRRK